MTKTADIKRYTDAVKLDILDLLNRERLGVFEFRRIERISQAMIPLLNSAGTSFTHQSIADALWAAEDIAPTLHAALGGHIFDGDTLLAQKYETMRDQHSELRNRYEAVLEHETEMRRVAAHVMREARLVGSERQLLAQERKRLALGPELDRPMREMPRLSATGEVVEPQQEDLQGEET